MNTISQKIISRGIATLLLVCPVTYASAQNTIQGRIISEGDNLAIEGGYVIMLQDGKVVAATQSDKKGTFLFKDKAAGNYVLEISSMGYATSRDSLCVEGNMEKTYLLKRLDVNLAEATVTADASENVKRMANGQRFVLSAEAKKLRNPFQALQEIPMLISDPNTSSVKLLDGSSPLILIDGNMVNSGISPLSPADIESVEVINVVSARYLQDGVSSIVNIRLRKGARPYLWLEAATRHDVPLDNGFGVGYFEVGNQKYSLYGRLAYNYTYHEDTESSVKRENVGYTQSYEQQTRNDAGSWLGELLFKYCATPQDYLAIQAYGSFTDTKAKLTGEGLFTPLPASASQHYLLNAYSKDKSKIATASLYYKHSFDDLKTLETRLAYNYSQNDNNASRTDAYDDVASTNLSIFDNERHSGSLNIDYSYAAEDGTQFILGSSSHIQRNEIGDMTILADMPVFKHNYFNQFFYAGYGGSVKGKFYYGASLGIEGIWQKSADRKSHYFRPRASANATYVFNSHNSLQLGYTLTNTSPSVANLNPYNISTDSLIVEVGNPDLKPQTMNYVRLNYTLNVGKFYLTPNVYYKYISDMIEAYGYTHDGIYYNTYANEGHFSQTSAGINLSYRFKWGRIYGGGGWYANYYEGQNAKHMAYASCGFNARVKDFSFYGDVDYANRSYTQISYTKYYRPSTATLQVNYNFTPDFYIGICLQHFAGKYRTKTFMDDGSFHSVVENRYTEQNVRPFFILRYTFRKNQNRQIKLGKVLSSEEQGISIKR